MREEHAMARNVSLALLGLAGAADSAYMLAYTLGLTSSLRCPFLGEGCNIVGRSKEARHLSIPNSAAGLAYYLLVTGLSLVLLGKPEQGRPRAAATRRLLAVAGMLASAYLTWEQGAKVRAWCFWCLTSAALNAAILLSSLPAARLGRARARHRGAIGD